MAPSVPHCRDIKPGMSGGDVIAVKRALSRWDDHVYIWAEVTRQAGPFFVFAVKQFQKAKGIPQTGNIGATTQSALERTHRRGHPTEWAFDNTAIGLATAYCKANSKTPEQLRRESIGGFALLCYQRQALIGYSQRRPFVGPQDLVDSDFSRIDCSGFVTDCYQAAGAPDPNGRGFDGQGYTGTLMGHGQPTTLAALEVGDLAFYGFTTRSSPAFPYGSPTHVAIIASLAPIIAVVSMGSDAGPSFLPYNYRATNPRCPFRTYPVL